MASAVDSRLAYARLSAVATASRLPTANRGSNNSYTTSWDTTDLETWRAYVTAAGFRELHHYYRPPGRPRAEQPWLATVWRKSSAN